MSARAGLLAVGLLVACSACSALASPHPGDGSGKLQVVAAENMWGSIAAQLGGDRVEVKSVISSPDIDPHSYEPTARDERAIASSDFVVFNGLGYDEWAAQAVEANADPHRQVLDIGDLLHLDTGDDPHRWYHPDDVTTVIAAITAAYTKLDPAGAADYARLRTEFESTGLTEYHALLADIEHRFAGTPVGATESAFTGIAEATGLDLITPPGFLAAISESEDPTAGDKSTVDEQITGGLIEVLVVNRQNATPDVQALEAAARAHGVEVSDITETLAPPSASFQDWQSAQLRDLRDALARATNR
jgi:zinc/manganese transport system substrate-binding protein